MKRRATTSLAARRHELVDPAKRFVARELEARWNGALEKVVEIERRIEELRATAAARPKIDRAALMRLAHDLPAAWNAPTTDTRTKQRLIHILIQEIVCNLDDAANEVVLLIHWTGGRHSELRVPRVKTDCCSTIWRPTPSMRSANSLVVGPTETWPCRLTACAAKPATARPGRQCVCARCASVSASSGILSRRRRHDQPCQGR